LPRSLITLLLSAWSASNRTASGNIARHRSAAARTVCEGSAHSDVLGLLGEQAGQELAGASCRCLSSWRHARLMTPGSLKRPT
jgi:hypothetical protein